MQNLVEERGEEVEDYSTFYGIRTATSPRYLGCKLSIKHTNQESKLLECLYKAVETYFCKSNVN